METLIWFVAVMTALFAFAIFFPFGREPDPQQREPSPQAKGDGDTTEPQGGSSHG